MNSFFADMKHSEIQVANFLKELGLHWIYESPVFIHDEKNRPRIWTPAFFIPWECTSKFVVGRSTSIMNIGRRYTERMGSVSFLSIFTRNGRIGKGRDGKTT